MHSCGRRQKSDAQKTVHILPMSTPPTCRSTTVRRAQKRCDAMRNGKAPASLPMSMRRPPGMSAQYVATQMHADCLRTSGHGREPKAKGPRAMPLSQGTRVLLDILNAFCLNSSLWPSSSSSPSMRNSCSHRRAPPTRARAQPRRSPQCFVRWETR